VIPPAVELRPGEALEAAWYDGGSRVAFTLTEAGGDGYWVARVSVHQSILAKPLAARLIRALLDREMVLMRRIKQAATS
jgi:hypothetical protein